MGLTFALGVKIPDSGADANGVLRLSVGWSLLNWSTSFPLPGAAVLLGTRNKDEVVLSGRGVDGVGYGLEEGFIIVPFAGAAYRHWFSPATSLGVTARWVGQYKPRRSGSWPGASS